MRKSLAAALTLVVCSTTLSAQDKNWRKNLTKSLEEMYQVSRVQLFDDNWLSKTGGVFVIQTDGVLGEVAVQSGTRLTKIRDGKIEADKVSGNIVSSMLSGKTREDARLWGHDGGRRLRHAKTPSSRPREIDGDTAV